MFRVITRSMTLYRHRHGGRSPRRVMVHKSTEFKDAEVLGCFEALPLCEAVDLIQVVEDVGWRGARWERDQANSGGKAAAFRSEEHTSELQSLMRISYAVFCLTKKNAYGNNMNV